MVLENILVPQQLVVNFRTIGHTQDGEDVQEDDTGCAPIRILYAKRLECKQNNVTETLENTQFWEHNI